MRNDIHIKCYNSRSNNGKTLVDRYNVFLYFMLKIFVYDIEKNGVKLTIFESFICIDNYVNK